MFKLKYLFSKVRAELIDFKQHNLGQLTEKDWQSLRVTKQSSLRDIYFSYMKHISLYEQQKLEDKMEAIRSSYIRILSHRLQDIESLNDQEVKDLGFLRDNNYGFPFVEGVRRSEIISQYQEHQEKKEFYQYPRLSLALAWLILGVPSFWLSDEYKYV